MSSEDIATVVQEIRERVRRRYEKKVPGLPDFELPSLHLVGEARDAAEGKVSAIGSVNPRRPSLLNNLAQRVKRLIARLLHWHVRDQVDFNRAVVRYLDRSLEAQTTQNQNLLKVAQSLAELQRDRSTAENQFPELKMQVDDLTRHWNEWRPAWEGKLADSEIQILHGMREIEAGARDREESFRQSLQQMHSDYLIALSRAAEETQNKVSKDLEALQSRCWNDLEELQSKFWRHVAALQTEQEKLIQIELRVLRRRAAAATLASPGSEGGTGARKPVSSSTTNSPVMDLGSFDYARFEERFRGSESFVADSQKFYLPYFKGCRRVLDLGCGRGELLESLRKHGVSAEGVDADATAVAACAEKKLPVAHGDLFAFLAEQGEGSVDGIFCSHVAEHLEPKQLVQLILQGANVLSPGGVAAFETPNPSCLGVLASDFYLDPTHVRPIPSQLMHFLLEEAGFVGIEVHERHPASEVWPEVAALDKVQELRGFRSRFFGGLDYAIIGRKVSA